ncbi:hypothetical protein CANARDRAFT_8947 [[Candida] arabinofermentans NRRL YB-2248]|uniref:Chromatin-remodeling ATPase INO80 n=1 Tax=[Candida] arabinofermentans NRRL YB-2248 TaxID=983967 RepID=A0A1E4SXP0_9ASCO|nr:hypothetical protein CANARDRAFT_8947 [[Candida] arabinofermentans NRRL YB-2248]
MSREVENSTTAHNIPENSTSDQIVHTNGSKLSHRMSISAMLSSPSHKDDTVDQKETIIEDVETHDDDNDEPHLLSHTNVYDIATEDGSDHETKDFKDHDEAIFDDENGTVEPSTDESIASLPETISADDLLLSFKSRLSDFVALDSVNINEANQLKLLDNEFKLLTTTNGIYVEPKLVESLKSEVLGLDGKLSDKLLKREKNLQLESDELKELKSSQLRLLAAQQVEKDRQLVEARLEASQPLKGKRKKREVSKKIDDSLDPSAAGFIDIAPKGRKQKSPSSTLQMALTEDTDDSASVGPPSKRKRRTKQEIETAMEEKAKLPPGKKRKKGTKGSKAIRSAQDPTEDGVAVSKRGGRRPGAGAKKQIKPALSDDESLQDPEDKYENEAKLPRIKLTLKPKISSKEQKAIDKQYDNTYISIWKDLSRKDGPKAYRLYQQSTQAKQINLRKTAMLAARESKKWQIKTNKSQKDLLTKARRSMREMLNFWKKNEKEERNLRAKAEQDAVNKAKKEEEERESRRQSRKLNFLLNQTELYSHFIGKNIKTDEFEGEMSDKNLSNGAKANDYTDEVDLAHANSDIQSLNFEDGNDEALKKTAAANAQTALLEAQNKAKAFNNSVMDEDGEMNFQNPTSIGDINIEQPKLLNCTLKEYQVKGLNWLATLYEQGINGILADEMGLGKTVQSISVLAYLAETHNIWGPFLVVTPASTLHNWQQEITRFVPDFKVLPYWGTAKDRKVLRKFWDRKSIVYKKESPIHVVVTSYQLVVADIQYFQKMKWQYMILDEAQAIKSSNSSRWRSLLSLQCRNRLLLTGTPIQNSMQELWALLHFIMPQLFDSHDEFSEWFSKDIESHANSNTQLNEQQLSRLHMILKPFMLRRIKKNVQSELGDKIEIDVICELTNRQKKLYRMLRSQINIMDLIDNNKRIGIDDENATESLMNVVMQFRKVCNHPDLFERADTKSAFSCSTFAETSSFLRENNESYLEAFYSTKNEIEYRLPQLIHDEMLTPDYNNQFNDKDSALRKLSIWNPENITDSENFSFLRFINETPNDAIKHASRNVIENAIDLKSYTGVTDGELLERFKTVYQLGQEEPVFTPTQKLFLIDNPEVRNEEFLNKFVAVQDKVYKEMYLKISEPCAFPIASAPPIELICSRNRMNHTKKDILFNAQIRAALSPLALNTQQELIEKHIPVNNWPKAEMAVEPISSKVGSSSIRLPSMKRFVIESTKLAQLDKMLVDLKKGGHKCLVYFQMTRMMDLMEEYLTYRQYKYIRLDGSSKLSDRRDLVHDWQTKPELFIFLLSTRAGGLGINLTAADTVIFYDSDWNPTIDSQAMDRAHRLGQTRQVTVYRLLVKGTIEERMRDRAKQKEHVQQVVMQGNPSMVTDHKDKEKKEKKEMAMWLLNDGEEDKDLDELLPSNGNGSVAAAKEENSKVEKDNEGDIQMT